MMENIPLLKSIENKDPSLNWNIDVSAELEKYLSAIELLDEDINYSQNLEVNGYGRNNESINTGNGNYTQLFNFVEAALIIQNSTSLYSKKIEHLHSLVFDTFHLLSTGKSQLTDCKTGSDENVNISNQLNNKTNISEKSTAFLMSNIVSVPIKLLQPGKNINLPFEQFGNNYNDETKTKYSSYSSYIGVSSLGSNISLPQYRIDTFSNTLFLDEADLGYFSSNISSLKDEYLGDMFIEQTAENGDFQDELDREIQDNCRIYDVDIEEKDDNGHTEVELDGIEIESQDYIEDFGNSENELPNDASEKGEQCVRGKALGRKEKIKEDYWVFMDEHVKIGKDKPLKPGKNYKIPSRNYTISLEGLSQKEDILDFIDVYTLSSYFMGLTEIGGEKYKVGNQKLPYFSDLKPPKLNVEKLLIFDSPDNDFLRSLEPEFNESTFSWKKHHSKLFFSNMEKKRKELSNYGLGNDNEQDISEFNEFEVGETSEYGLDQTQDVISDSELALDVIEDQTQDDENIIDDGKSQEEQITRDSNLVDINFEQSLSELHERINMWTGHVEPLLQAQNSRPEFNIHEEGKKIIERIKEVNVIDQQPIRFEKVTNGFSKWQVCRSFLATLMLSNNREIDILQENRSNSDEDLDFFSIRLLDENEKNEVLNTNAPIIEKVGKAKLDFPKKKKTKKDLISFEEDKIEFENKVDKTPKLNRKRGNKS